MIREFGLSSKMSYHVNFLKAVITKPLHVLRKDYDTARHGRKSSTLTPDIPNVVIDGIYDEDFIVDPQSSRKKVIHRIFAKSLEAPDYKDVGWILNDDVDICMLCRRSPFGMFAYKHHCKACGNIFCSECSQSTAQIRELRGLGDFRVCNLCFYGQDTVDCTPNRPKPVAKQVVPVVQQKVQEETPEEKLRKLKMQQQEEFQRAAMERMRQPSTAPTSGSGRADRASLLAAPSTTGNASSAATASTTATASKSSQMTAEVACQLLDTDVDTEERRRRMLYYGELRTITPSPGFVVKTKRSNGTKIFVNVCSSTAVPLKTEPSSTRIDANKKIYMLVNTPVEHQNEKDGSYCVLYDVLVHPDELTVCALDATGAARARLNNQIMQLLVAAYREDVSMTPKVLQITSNYKGRDDVGSGSAVRGALVPATQAFIAVPQIPAVPPPIASTAVNASTPRDRAGSDLSTNSGKQRTRTLSLDETARLSMAGSGPKHRESVVQLRGSTILATVGDSAGLGVDRTLKSMVLPREELSRLFGKNFNFILDTMKSHEVNLKDILLYPEPGFVISVMRQRPSQRLYINVTHHPAVGFVTQLFANGGGGGGGDEYGNASPSTAASTPTGSGKRRSYIYTLPTGRTNEIPKPLPHIIGQVSADVADPFEASSSNSGNNGGRATVVDIVVPSAIFFAALQDKTGDLREQLAKEVLVRLAALHIRLAPDFQLLTQPLYLQTNALFLRQDELSEVVPPVLNLTETEKTIYSAAFIGKVFKQGHGVKSWKERLTFVAENKLQYFDLRMNFKGEFNVEDCSLAQIDATSNATESRDSETAAGSLVGGAKAMGIPSTGFGFQLVNYASGGQFLNCYVLSEYMRDLYQLVLSARNAHISSLKTLIQIPDMKTGWLLKQGHLVRNWRRRFFVLNYGVLSYYEQDNVASKKGTAEAPKGKINLKGAKVIVVVTDEQGGGGRMTEAQERLSITDASGSLLIVQMQNKDEKKEWFEALRRHVLYANEYND